VGNFSNQGSTHFLSPGLIIITVFNSGKLKWKLTIKYTNSLTKPYREELM